MNGVDISIIVVLCIVSTFDFLLNYFILYSKDRYWKEFFLDSFYE